MRVGQELVQAPLGHLTPLRRIKALLKLLANPLLVEIGRPRLLDDKVHLARAAEKKRKEKVTEKV